MKLILSQFLPPIHLYYTSSGNLFPFILIRLRNSPVLIRIYGLKIIGSLITADSITIHTKHKTKITFYNVQYRIHEYITVQSVEISINTLSIFLHMVTLRFNPTFHVLFESLEVKPFVTVKRFDKNEPIMLEWKQPYSIRIPEVRIHTRPPVSLIQSWKSSIDAWIPKEKNEEPLPVIHISSIFIRFHSWCRCIAPISTGNKSIWELYEHIVRAVIRI